MAEVQNEITEKSKDAILVESMQSLEISMEIISHGGDYEGILSTAKVIIEISRRQLDSPILKSTTYDDWKNLVDGHMIVEGVDSLIRKEVFNTFECNNVCNLGGEERAMRFYNIFTHVFTNVANKLEEPFAVMMALPENEA
jgi:hypothetical protein